MELRDIEIFLTLAEELHFGRTAERLHVSQARVSHSIAKQERQIGARLFARSSRRVELTPIGAQLRDDLDAGYQRIRDGIRDATAAGRGARSTLTLGLHGPQAHDQSELLDLFRNRHPDTELRIREMNFTDPFGPLRDGMVSTDHPLASRDEVGMEDLADWVLPYCGPPTPEYWLQTLVPAHTPSGRPIRRGPKVTTFQEVAAAVAAGHAVSLVHGDAARYYRWPGLRYLHPHDAPTGEWALIWPTAQETDAIRALARAARDTGPRTA
ncbi:LysR family transcriptional regulator [Streptomyces sp. NPDC005395]|uniref:LysR family transcriptional regulator n=1 Tax=unclassified Streptomyces TaxID=2593676 RepID=UPI0033B827E2